MQGSIPSITKGRMALFLGGADMLTLLDDRPPGRAMVNFVIFTIIFQTTLENNVLNIYGLVFFLALNLFSSSLLMDGSVQYDFSY